MDPDAGIRYEVDGHVARITIDRPERRNAVDPRAHLAFSEALDEVESDDDQWILVITGAGDQAFCAGRDLKNLAELSRATPEERARQMDMYNRSTRFIERFEFPKPVIARVNGHAHGGGFEVALACDLIIAADHATFALPEVLRGLFPGGGGTERLPRQIPLKIAMGHMLTGKPMTAARALELGVVNEVVPMAELDAAVDRWIAELLAAAPLAVRATKEKVMRGLDSPQRAAFFTNWPSLQRWRESDEPTEGPRAFAEKRAPNWTG